MAPQRLRELLEEVRAELARTGSVDEESRALLESVTDDIDALVERSEGEPPSLMRRLEDAAAHFEESHPRLAATIGQMAETLERMGI